MFLIMMAQMGGGLDKQFYCFSFYFAVKTRILCHLNEYTLIFVFQLLETLPPQIGGEVF